MADNEVHSYWKYDWNTHREIHLTSFGEITEVSPRSVSPQTGTLWKDSLWYQGRLIFLFRILKKMPNYSKNQFTNIDLSTNNKIIVMKYTHAKIFKILYKIIFGLYNLLNLYSSDFK
jgi:hypothetical protein